MIDDVLSNFGVARVCFFSLFGGIGKGVVYKVFRTMGYRFVSASLIREKYSLNLGKDEVRSMETVLGITPSLMVTVSEFSASNL